MKSLGKRLFHRTVTLTFIIDLGQIVCCVALNILGIISSQIHQSKFNGIFSVRKFTPNMSWPPRHEGLCLRGQRQVVTGLSPLWAGFADKE